MEQGDDNDDSDAEDNDGSRREMYFCIRIFVESGQSSATGRNRYFVVCHGNLFQDVFYNPFGIFIEIVAVVLLQLV